LEGTKTLKEVGDELVELITRVANGEPAKAEYYNIQEFAIPNISVVKKEVLHEKMARLNDYRFMA